MTISPSDRPWPGTPAGAIGRPEADRFCPHCGAGLSPAAISCQQCGRVTPRRSAVLDATDPAPVPRRVAAAAIDAAPLVLLLIGFLVTVLVLDDPPSWSGKALLLGALAWCLLLWGWASATGQGPGKAMLGLRAVDEGTGGRVGPLRTLVRLTVRGFATIGTLGGAALSYRWDPAGREQTWWDRLAGSRVIASTSTDGSSRFDPLAESRWTPAPLPPVGLAPTPTFPVSAVPPPPLPAVGRPIASATGPPRPVQQSADEAPTRVVARQEISGQAGEVTNVVARRDVASDRPVTATLEWDSGARVVAGGIVLIGRDPVPLDDEQVDRRLAVGQESVGVSKTHLKLIITAGGITVTDLRSTNGVRIERDDGSVTPCPAGEPVAVREGDRIRFGGRSILVAPPS
jgi:pSer/pThr/pTyr-binding forkhead associated (FHA) protein/uncharacterized RDD family membrane protein YckC